MPQRTLVRPLFFLGLAVSCLPTLVQGQAGPTVASAPTLHDLRSVLDTGVVIQDRNGDRVADFLEVRILLGPQPAA